VNDSRQRHTRRARALSEQLETAVRTGAAADVARALESIGSVLRRKAALSAASPSELLARLPERALLTWLASVSVDAVSEQLLRASLESVEAGLSDGEDAQTWRTWAEEALWARDDLESALTAVESWCTRNDAGPAVARETKRLRSALVEVDARSSPRARWLGPLNATRRAERDLLDSEARGGAWWFTARIECDALLGALAGGSATDAHLASCIECRQDLAAAKTVDARRLRHLGQEELWRLDMSAASQVERTLIETHASRCAECAQAIQALDEGEAFIAEALGEPPQPLAPRRPAPEEPMRARRREVLAERPGFKLVLIRERKRTKLLVERASPAAAIRAEAVQGSEQPRISTESNEGLEIQLADDATGPVLVRVFGPGKQAPWIFPVAL
jgi:hypothetical protein